MIQLSKRGLSVLILARRVAWCAAAAYVFGGPRLLFAQDAARLVADDTITAQIGQRVRVVVAGRLPDPMGRLTRVSADSLWVRTDDSRPPIAHARDAVRQFEVSRGVPGRARRGWIGAGVVGVAGGVVGAMFGQALAGTCGDCATSSRGAWVGGSIGALTGAGFGALFGSAGGRERWVAARLPAEAPAPARGDARH